MKKKKRKRIGRISNFFVVIISIFIVLIFAGHKNELPADSGSVFVLSENYSESDKMPWELILVNGKNHIPDNYEFELMKLDNGNSIDSRIYPDLQAMFDDMRSIGIYPVVSEGYRTADEQKQMMTDKINAYINDGYSPKEAEKLASQLVAKVGYSEHQLGLAADINADKKYSSNEEVYGWLLENAYKYGFILRYPADKTDITGIDFEPWHYRYVGKDAAFDIFSDNICLEEYLEMNHP